MTEDMGKLFEMAMAVKNAMDAEELSTGEEVMVETMLVSMTVVENNSQDPDGFKRDLRRFCKGLLKVRLETFGEGSATVKYPGKERLQ